jgi:nitric oxide reductase large subunit
MATPRLFGVYGMLGIGLMLFCLRGLRSGRTGTNPLLRGSFWTMNIGLALMALLTLLPLGVLQLRGDRARLLVRALGGVHEPGRRAPAGLDAGAR